MKRLIILTFIVLLSHFALSEATVVIKLGTLAPKESPWHDLLKEMAAQWEEASGGQVEVKIFAGGAVGDEPDMVRKMRIGQLHAAALTTVGLGTIDKSTQAFHIPLALASYEELDYVRERISPKMEAALREKGYIVLNWGDAGWVHFFIQQDTGDIEAVKDMKLFVWAGDPAGSELWKDGGFKPVPLATTDVLQGLQTGMVNAFDNTPLAALSMQWFAFNKFMLNLKWAPLTGGTIISEKTWNKIPADLQPKLLEIAKKTGDRMKGEIRKLEKDAIDAMVKRGLKIVELTPQQLQEWDTTVEKMYPRIRGEIVPPEIFDEVIKLRDEYRKQHPAKAGKN